MVRVNVVSVNEPGCMRRIGSGQVTPLMWRAGAALAPLPTTTAQTHHVARPFNINAPQRAKGTLWGHRKFMFSHCNRQFDYIPQCASALSGPPNSGLGSIPHHYSHGASPLLSPYVYPHALFQILVGVLRHYVVVLLQSPPAKLPRAAIREQCVLITDTWWREYSDASRRRALVRSNILRATSTNSPIPFTFYQTISQNLSKAFAEGTYLKDGPPKQGENAPPPNPLSDPAAMDGMMAGMRTQMVMMVPQMIVMGWINFFFEGFVVST